jgi:hypothetical protein
MQDAKDRKVLRAREPLKQSHDLLACFWVEARYRFIGQQYARPLRERARNGDALRYTSGEHASALFSEVGETDIGEVTERRLELGGRKTAERRPPAEMPAEGSGRHISQYGIAPNQTGVLRDHR